MEVGGEFLSLFPPFFKKKKNGGRGLLMVVVMVVVVWVDKRLAQFFLAGPCLFSVSWSIAYERHNLFM